jgi:cytochrome c oxidase assembly factor CtaG/cytochrome c551/c552
MITAFTSAALALLAALYLAALCSRRAARVLRGPRFLAFVAGWTTFAAALLSPLHELAERSLSAHMIQHELLMVIAAPLLALARLDLALLAWLSGRRRRLAAGSLRRLRVSMPSAWALHAVALWLWHLPVLYEWAVEHPLAHAAQHASFTGTALLFWWAALAPQTSYGAAALGVFLTSLHSGLLGVLLFLSPRLWYRSYAPAAALEDQQLAGLIMWVGGGVVLAVVALGLVWRWLLQMEERAAARARLASLKSTAARASALLLLLASAALSVAACNNARATAVALTGGNPDNGKEAIRKYGCWTCHTIPGIHGANAVVGPPLDKIAARAYVAGRPNSPAHLMKWIRHPQEVRNPTPMPDMGVTEADARDIAAYLYTLR